jgi:hypothetical protein
VDRAPAFEVISQVEGQLGAVDEGSAGKPTRIAEEAGSLLNETCGAGGSDGMTFDFLSAFDRIDIAKHHGSRVGVHTVVANPPVLSADESDAGCDGAPGAEAVGDPRSRWAQAAV